MKSIKEKLARNRYNRRYYGRTKNAPMHRKPWEYEEILLVQFAELTDHEIAAKINRSVQAIQTKRSRLNHEK